MSYYNQYFWSGSGLDTEANTRQGNHHKASRRFFWFFLWGVGIVGGWAVEEEIEIEIAIPGSQVFG